MLSFKVCTVVDHWHTTPQWYKHKKRCPHDNYHNKTIFITVNMSKKAIRCNTVVYRNNNPVVTGYQNSY